MNKKIKYMVMLVMGTSLFAGSPLEKIDLSKKQGSALEKIDLNEADSQPVKEYRKMKLKKYNVSYKDSFEQYSAIFHDKDAFNEYLGDHSVSKSEFKRMFGSVDDRMSTILSSLAYDWVGKKPELAENFYKALLDQEDLSSNTKILIADYYLRTGRPEKITGFLYGKDCLLNLKKRHICYYYRGLSIWAKTGDARNEAMKSAALDGVKKAKKILRAYRNKR